MKSELFSSISDHAAEHASEHGRRLSNKRAESEVSHCLIFVGVSLYIKHITFGRDFKLPNYSVLDLFKFLVLLICSQMSTNTAIFFIDLC